jgi:formate C-acetyltransferase
MQKETLDAFQKMSKPYEDLEIPEFDLEDFMKSITYAPEGMSANLARELLKKDEKFNNLSAPLFEAEVIAKTLELLPIGINEDDLIAGNYGVKYATEEYMDKVRKADEYELAQSPQFKIYSDDEKIISGRHVVFGIYTPAHTCMDYGTMITKGLKYYLKKIEHKKKEQQRDGYADVYLRAMETSLKAVVQFAERYAKLAEQLAGSEKIDEARRNQLLRISGACRKVPLNPAEDFFEALQFIWIIHTAIPASERSWASISLGRMDRYLYSYYKNWLETGKTEQEAEELLCAFFRLLDSYGDGSCALNIGGDRKTGYTGYEPKDAVYPESWNELSKLLLRVEKRVRLRSPIFVARVTQELPQEIYDEMTDRSLFEIGQPTFYSEEACYKAMLHRGIEPEAAKNFSLNSCMGLVIAGDELADMWGCVINMHLALELAVNGGNPIRGVLPESISQYVKSGLPEKISSIEELKAAYAIYLEAVVSYAADMNLRRAAWIAANRPNPLLSALTNDCIEQARDRAHGAVAVMGQDAKTLAREYVLATDGRGAKYHNVTVLAMGFANTADAFTAIHEFVFKSGKYTLQQLIGAARDNYQGSLLNEQIYHDLQKCGKFGTANDAADENAAFVLNTLADICEALQRGTIRYLPSCHTIDANARFGMCIYATLDGRKNGEPLNKNIGPVNLVRRSNPTELVLSSSRMPQVRFSGGQPIDLYVPSNFIDSIENKHKFQKLMEVYFARGGMQVQVNSINLDLLKRAYEHPEQYGSLIIRKGGFSVYFTEMYREVQKETIERFEMEQRV